jgi:hypothetical protein
VSKEVDEALRRWSDRTPALAAIKGASDAAAAGTASAGGGKKGAKGDGKGKKKK